MEKIIFTKPKNLTKADKQKLEALGYTVIVTKDPDGIRFGNDLRLIKFDELSMAAFESIAGANYDQPKLIFARKILHELINPKTSNKK